MNIQALMKQAQKMQKEMMDSKQELDKKIFSSTSSLVTIELYGNKEVKSVKINADILEKEDIEILEDMILVAINDTIKKIDKETESTMGKYTQNMPGLF